MIHEIVFEFLLLILQVIVEVMFLLTGEIVLFVISLGRHKPRWDLYTKETVPKWWLFTQLSAWVGAAFWIIATTCFGYYFRR